MSIRSTYAIARFITAGAVLVAIGTQLAYGLQTTHDFSIVNFFSFFTILSNFLAAAIVLASGVALLARINREPLAYWRGAATLYMVITGIVYAILLTNVDVQTPLPWVNAIIHYIFPVLILIDWLLDPPEQSFSLKSAAGWLLFPLAYAIYSLVRGPLANDWYPYPFINVHELGYVQVLINCLALIIVGVILTTLIARLPRLFGRGRTLRLKSLQN